MNLGNSVEGPFGIFSSCIDRRHNDIFLATNRGVIKINYVTMMDDEPTRGCINKLFSTTNICKCLAVWGNTVAFAVHDLDNGSKLSSNTLVVM